MTKPLSQERLMRECILRALNNGAVRLVVQEDFCHTFRALGMLPGQAKALTLAIFQALQRLPTVQAEAEARRMIGVAHDTSGRPLQEVLAEKLSGRAQLIHSQIKPHLQDCRGASAIDFGCGDGLVAQALRNDPQLMLDIRGIDVRHYPAPGVTVPMGMFNGKRTSFPNKAFHIGIMTNVAHHDAHNERVLCELSRIVYRKLVVIETVPVGDTLEALRLDRLRTFMNDWLYNRAFHDADVPVPGTYEDARGWIARFGAHGWSCVHDEDLGYDQPTIRDVHHLYVFVRR